MKIEDIKTAIKKSYIRYVSQNYSSRNSEPAKIMHGAISNYIKENIIKDTNLSIWSAHKGSEYVFKSKYHEKKIDITIVDNGKPVVAISFKMPLSSVNKNLRNYFEMNTGDASLVREQGVPFFFFMILDKYSIRFDHHKFTIENISPKSLSPFVKVMNSTDDIKFRPEATFISLVDFGDQNFKIKMISMGKNQVKQKVNEHVQLLLKNNIYPKVLNSQNKWSDCFDSFLNSFFDLIKLEIEKYKIKKKIQMQK